MLYMVTWIPSIYPSHVSIYTSIMDPMGNMSLWKKGKQLLDYIGLYIVAPGVRWHSDTMEVQHSPWKPWNPKRSLDSYGGEKKPRAPADIPQQQPGEINSHSLILFPPNGHKCWNAARTSGLCSFSLEGSCRYGLVEGWRENIPKTMFHHVSSMEYLPAFRPSNIQIDWPNAGTCAIHWRCMEHTG